MPALSTTAALMEHLRNCYDAIHPYATQTIRIHAHRLARTTLIPGMTAADYEQQLALDLWRRLPVYDPKRAALATFIDRVVRRRVCDFLHRCPCGRHGVPVADRVAGPSLLKAATRAA